MSRPSFITSFELGECVDLIDDCLWGDYIVHITLPDGRELADCSVQSDGHVIAWETLVDDAGNLLYDRLADMAARVDGAVAAEDAGGSE